MMFRRSQSGFTLIEVVVSISIFALITVGITPLLVSSVRGSGLSRSYTIAKNVASDAMEGARGLPFYIQNTVTTSPQKKDFLDLYFPDLTTGSSTGYFTTTSMPAPDQATTRTNVYKTVCGAVSSNPACPLESSGNLAAGRPTLLPPGYTLEFYAQFVKAVPGTSSTAETYTVEPPTSDYTWTSATGKDLPPTGLVKLTVRVGWTYLGQPRSFRLTSLLGERKLASIKVQGAGQVAYTAKVLTSYVDANGNISDLNAVRGISTSSVLTRLLAGSIHETKAAEIALSRVPSVAVPSPSPIPPLLGAQVSAKAPPTASIANVSALEGFLTHPDLAGTPKIAFISPSSTSGVSLSAADGLPSASGSWTFSSNVEANQTTDVYDRVQQTRSFWVTNQADALPGSLMHFTDDPMFVIHPQGSGSGASGGTASTSATTTRLDSNRKVETTAAASFRNLCLLPTDFIPGGCVVKMTNFSSSVSCKATGSTSGSNPAAVSGSYSLTLSYWRDATDNATRDGAYVDVPISVAIGSTATNLLASIRSTNALVYDDANPLLDVYLFPTTTGNRGYLTDWSMLTSIPNQIAATNRSAAVQLNGALQLTTAPTNPAIDQTGMNISIGSLNCSAVDNR